MVIISQSNPVVSGPVPELTVLGTGFTSRSVRVLVLMGPFCTPNKPSFLPSFLPFSFEFKPYWALTLFFYTRITETFHTCIICACVYLMSVTDYGKPLTIDAMHWTGKWSQCIASLTITIVQASVVSCGLVLETDTTP